MRALDWRRGWAVTRWQAERGLLRLHLPLVRIVQHPQWSQWWHRLADLHVTRPRQALALLVVAALWYFGAAWWGHLLCAPAYVALAFGAGRLVYPHTRRGRPRTQYRDRDFADINALLRGVSARKVKTSAVDGARPTRPGLQRATTHACGRRSEWATVRLPVSECGTWLGATAVGPPLPVRCYAEHQDAVGLLAPPRSLKTAVMAGWILNHPGAVLSTQIRAETYWLTRDSRANLSRSGRVELLDPECLSGDKSTFRWAPHSGCRRPVVALERAAAMAAAAHADGDDAEWLANEASKALASILLGADVNGDTMLDVYRRAAGGMAGLQEAAAALERHPDATPPGWLDELVALYNSTATRTQGAILMTLASAVGFMGDPDCAQLCLPGPGEATFDVASWLADRGTVYVIASDREHSKIEPLLAVFTAHVFEEAKRIAGPKGRIDPPLALDLDEVANTIVVPLPQWVSHGGGSGIQVRWTAQSKSQLAERWGENGAKTVLNATTAKLVAGGLTVEEDLRGLSELCGTRVVGQDQNGNDITVPRMTVDDIRELPPMTALLVHRSTPVTIVRVTPAWELLAAKGPWVLRAAAWLSRPDVAVWRRLVALARRGQRSTVVEAPMPPRAATPMPLVIDISPHDQPVTVPAEWSAHQPAETRS